LQPRRTPSSATIANERDTPAPKNGERNEVINQHTVCVGSKNYQSTPPPVPLANHKEYIHWNPVGQPLCGGIGSQGGKSGGKPWVYVATNA